MEEFYPVGSTFEYNGEKFKVKEGTSCTGCASYYKEFLCFPDGCSSTGREDAKSVIFVKVKDKKDKPKNSNNLVIDTSDDCTTKAEVHSSGSITVSSVHGYSDNVDILCTLVDNGNGYHVTSKSYSCTTPDHIFNLDYAEIEYIYLSYKALKKARKEK